MAKNPSMIPVDQMLFVDCDNGKLVVKVVIESYGEYHMLAPKMTVYYHDGTSEEKNRVSSTSGQVIVGHQPWGGNLSG